MPEPQPLDSATLQFYRDALRSLDHSGASYLVGGAHAFGHYTGIARDTKDFDVFCRRRDAPLLLAQLARMGCRTEMTFPHWLAKAWSAGTGAFVDVIFSAGSGVAVVDDEWFTHAREALVLGVPTRLCPAEEMIWSKSFIMERERYDGNDVAHLIRAVGRELDWRRLLRRFDGHWRVLLSHVVLFGFIYPAERASVPRWVEDDLLRRVRAEARAAPLARRVCRGTLLSRAQYLVDIGPWGYEDARLDPEVQMTAEDIDRWTRAIGTIE
jgi:hypothetical protein